MPKVSEDANVTLIVPVSDEDVPHVRAFVHRYVTLLCNSNVDNMAHRRVKTGGRYSVYKTVSVNFALYSMSKRHAISKVGSGSLALLDHD